MADKQVHLLLIEIILMMQSLPRDVEKGPQLRDLTLLALIGYQPD